MKRIKFFTIIIITLIALIFTYLLELNTQQQTPLGIYGVITFKNGQPVPPGTYVYATCVSTNKTAKEITKDNYGNYGFSQSRLNSLGTGLFVVSAHIIPDIAGSGSINYPSGGELNITVDIMMEQ